MDWELTLRPPSPHSQHLLSQFTTLYDDDDNVEHSASSLELAHQEPVSTGFDNASQADNNVPSRSLHENTSLNTTPLRTQIHQEQIDELHGNLQADRPPSQHKRITGKRDRRESPGLRRYGELCFSLSNQAIKIPRRSAFSEERRKEVNEIRKNRACLRCRLLRRSCSGDNPCRRCLSDAQASVRSRVLLWMECVRASLEDLNTFDIDAMFEPVKMSYLYLKPRAQEPKAASQYLTSWWTYVSYHSIYGSKETRDELQFGDFLKFLPYTSLPTLSTRFQLLSKLVRISCNHVEKSTCKATNGYPDAQELLRVSIIKDLDKMLKPTSLQSSNPEELYALLPLLCGMLFLCAFTETVKYQGNIKEQERKKKEALVSLLLHYYVYIGTKLKLIDPIYVDMLLKQRIPPIHTVQWKMEPPCKCESEHGFHSISLSTMKDNGFEWGFFRLHKI